MTGSPPAGGSAPNGNGNGNGRRVLGIGWAVPVTRTINALSGTPMLLVLAILNVMMFAMVTYLVIKSAEYRFKERAEIIEMLTECMKK